MERARIAYSGRVAGLGYRIMTVAPDGSDVRQVTRGPHGDDGWPAWRPDGARLCFAARRNHYAGLYVVAADGTGEERLTPTGSADDEFPDWSPCGRHVAYSRSNATGDRLFTVNVESRTERALTMGGAMDYAPSWSPSGELIAFRRSLASPAGIYVMPAGGGESWFLIPGNDPSWEPTGEAMAYAHAGGIWVARVASDGRSTQDRTRLTSGGEAEDRHPRWSPDGAHLVFERELLGYEDSACTLVVMRANDGAETCLGEGRAPDWSPVLV